MSFEITVISINLAEIVIGAIDLIFQNCTLTLCTTQNYAMDILDLHYFKLRTSLYT